MQDLSMEQKPLGVIGGPSHDVEDGESIAIRVGFEQSSTKGNRETEQVVCYLIRLSTGFVYSRRNDEFTRSQWGSKSNSKLCVFNKT